MNNQIMGDIILIPYMNSSNEIPLSSKRDPDIVSHPNEFNHKFGMILIHVFIIGTEIAHTERGQDPMPHDRAQNE